MCVWTLPCKNCATYWPLRFVIKKAFNLVVWTTKETESCLMAKTLFLKLTNTLP